MRTKPSFNTVRSELRRLGVMLSRTGWGAGEVRVHFPGADASEGYFTEDLADALDKGRAMAAWRMKAHTNAPTTETQQ